MKKSEIVLNGVYIAKVSNKLTKVKVLAIRSRFKDSGTFYSPRTTEVTIYDVVNLATGRQTTFRSAAKFRSEVKQPIQA